MVRLHRLFMYGSECNSAMEELQSVRMALLANNAMHMQHGLLQVPRDINKYIKYPLVTIPPINVDRLS